MADDADTRAGSAEAVESVGASTEREIAMTEGDAPVRTGEGRPDENKSTVEQQMLAYLIAR